MSCKTAPNAFSYKMLHHIGLALLLIGLCTVQYSCAPDKDAEWTILVYMAADNSLTEQAVQDIIEMERAKVSDEINIIVQLDPNNQHPDPQARRYKIQHNKSDYIASPVIEYLGEIDSGDFRNLASFVNWGIDKYPAKKISLIIWSHGSGWSRNGASADRGICPDQSNFNQISVANGQLKRAFDMFNTTIELLLIDACLMMSMEVLTEVYHKTNYVIGSENLTPYEGFPYQEMFDNWSKNHATANLAATIVSLYGQAHTPGGSQNPNEFTRQITVSAARTNMLDTLLDHLTDFVTLVSEEDYSEYLLKARRMSYGFHLGETEVDIKEYFSQLHSLLPDSLNEKTENIINAIDDLFVAQYSDNLPENTGTATVWFPLYGEYVQGSKQLYSKLIFAQLTDWISLLEASFEL